MNRKDKVDNYSAGYVDSDIKTDDHDKIMMWLDANIDSMVKKKGENYSVIRKIWEYPITMRGGRIGGYIDMLVEIGVSVKETESEVDHRIKMAEMDKRRGYDVEVHELSKEPMTLIKQDSVIAFEVKSRISNVGECIRQNKAVSMPMPGECIKVCCRMP